MTFQQPLLSRRSPLARLGEFLRKRRGDWRVGSACPRGRSCGGGAAWPAARRGGRRGRARTTGRSGSSAGASATPSTTTTRTASCRPAGSGALTTAPAAPGRAAPAPPRRKLCARVRDPEFWKNRNMLQCGSSGRAHLLTGTFPLTKTNPSNKTILPCLDLSSPTEVQAERS